MKQTLAITDGVHIGKDGHLFLASGGHAVFEYAFGERKVTKASLGHFSDNICARRKLANTFAIPYRHIIVPDKQSVLSDLVDGADVTIRLGEEYRTDALAGDVLYPLETLRALGANAFMRTDTHLTSRASVALARMIYHELTGETVGEEDDGLEAALTVRKSWVGDLGSKLTPPREADELFLHRTWGRIYSNNLTANDGLIDLHLNPGALRQAKLVIFGDSFARGIGQPLSRLFSEVLFLRSRFVHPEMVWLAQPDYLLSQNVERYLANVTPDTEAPPFFLYPNLPKAKSEKGSREELAEQLARMLRGPRDREMGELACVTRPGS